MQKAVNKVNKALSSIDMKINREKTEVIVI